MHIKYRGESKTLNDKERDSVPGVFIQLSNGITHYELFGSLEGKAIIFIHGIAGPLGIWEHIRKPLIDKGYLLLQYDLYGRGYSDRPHISYDLELFVSQLTDLLVGLSVPSPITLVGWSLGGMIAVVFAARHPELVDRLILIAPTGIDVTLPLISKIGMIPLVGELLMSMSGRQIALRSLAKGVHIKGRRDEYLDLVSKQMVYHGYLRSFLSTLRCLALYDAKEAYCTVGNSSLPALMIAGSDDRSIPQSATTKIGELIPHLDYIEMPNTGYIPHFEKPKEVGDLIINFTTSE